MRKVNWKIFNLALWTELVLCYVLPFQVIDGLRYQAGFPIAFLSFYNRDIHASPFLSMSLNPLGLLLDGAILYTAFSFAVVAYKKRRRGPARGSGV